VVGEKHPAGPLALNASERGGPSAKIAFSIETIKDMGEVVKRV